MELILSVVRCPDAAVPATRRVTGGEITIGRGETADWVLADPNRHLSKNHCTIAFRSGRWTVTDLSTNGTFLDRSAEPIGRGGTAPLRDGSRLTLGEYEIEVRIEERAQPGAGAGANPFADDPFAPPAQPPAPFQNDPFGRDPFAVEPPSRPVSTDPFGGLGGPQGGGGPTLPDDYDPLADIQGGDRLSDPSWTTSGSRPDHTPAASDAFVPPVVKTAIPDDWDLDLPQAAPAPSAQPEPAPSHQAREEGFGSHEPPPPPPRPAVPEPATHAPQPAAAPAAQGGEELLTAFLKGAGLPDLVRRSTVPPEELMRGLGAAFRAFVEGLREVLITRASIKSEFRIEQTIIAARGNNPLKFSPSVEDALAAMLGESRGAFMDAETAVRDSLDDIKHHELATMQAIQAGLRAVLAEIEPGKLREEAEAQGGLSLVPAQRRARAFDLFEQRFAALLRDADSSTDGTFARAFARAYEAAGGRG
ncbi:type VI secretion system-associated FHA domain protein TagH [Elioraea rosea]|uniref:type VI secretion system-associated FHA domain protein TagH n=1 Tax=Elioraea rosea TaxID=2492390 RepID=UPI001186D5A8|nr:type VI secretion system-associated FHA domain protein TagH [Elioraea rosea]